MFRETGQATPASCFVLHRMGFVMPPCFRSGRWALTPPFHPCFIALMPLAFSAKATGEMKRFVFCDTFRYKELSFSAPPLSRGVPPYGVRTFLFGVPCGAQATVRHQTKRYLETSVFQESIRRQREHELIRAITNERIRTRRNRAQAMRDKASCCARRD